MVRDFAYGQAAFNDLLDSCFKPRFAKVNSHTNLSTYSFLIHKLTDLCGS